MTESCLQRHLGAQRSQTSSTDFQPWRFLQIEEHYSEKEWDLQIIVFVTFYTHSTVFGVGVVVAQELEQVVY